MTVTESRLAVLKDILNQFGIERNGDELTLTSDTADFADAKNRFLQAIIKVGDMSMLANPMCRRILQVVPEFLRTLVFARPRGDDQFADCTFSPSLDMSR